MRKCGLSLAGRDCPVISFAPEPNRGCPQIQIFLCHPGAPGPVPRTGTETPKKDLSFRCRFGLAWHGDSSTREKAENAKAGKGVDGRRRRKPIRPGLNCTAATGTSRARRQTNSVKRGPHGWLQTFSLFLKVLA
jgi:hypothetical protein